MSPIKVQHWQTELGENFGKTGNCHEQPHEAVLVIKLKSEHHFWVEIAASAEKLREERT
jgi:hypothetical protein